MANYTSDEIQAAVEKIIRSTVRHPLGSLGERQVNVSFNDLQEAASGVYILNFNAPYYTLYLGTKRLLDSLAVQASTIASLIDAVQATKRAVTPVNDLTNLANAKAALEELQSAVSARSQGFNDIQAVPSFRRYAANLDAFLVAQSSNIKAKDTLGINGSIQGVDTTDTSSPAVGDTFTVDSPDGNPDESVVFAVVDTPAGARLRIPGLVSSLKQQQDELVRRVELLAGAMADFGKLNLPQLAAQGVISRAREVLAEHYTNLAALDENTRLEQLRAVALDLLAQRPLVEKYGAGLSPSQYVATKGLAKAYSDDLHPAVPARVLSTEAGPYNILEADHIMQVAVDGGAPFHWPLPLGYVAELNGTLAEPFILTSTSNQLTIVFDDPNAASPFTKTVVFAAGTPDADTIVQQINAAFVGSDLVAEAYFQRLKYDSLMSATSMGGNNAKFSILGGSLTGLGITVGDELDILDGPQDGTTWTITSVDAAGVYVLATGSQPVIVSAEEHIQIGSAARAIRLRDDDPFASLDMRRSIKLKATGGKEDACANALGFYAGMEVRSQPVMAADVATNINTSTSVFAAEVLDTAEVVSAAYSDVVDPTKITLSYFIGDGPITTGVDVTFQYEGELTGASGVVLVRDSATPIDIGVLGHITYNDVLTSTLTLHMESAVTAGLVTLEIGPDHIFKYGDPVVITDGPNKGRYTVREPQDVGTTAPFEVLLDRALPVNKTGSTPSKFTAQLGYSFIYFKSTKKSITSSITIDNLPGTHGAEYFFSPIELPATERGTTPYLQFDTYPTGTAVGDLVQLFEDQYNLVSRQFQVQSLEPSKRVFKITSSSGAGVESDFSMTFNQGVPNPFGAIRIAQTANYGTLKALLDAWLTNDELTTVYYRDLARLLNPVLTNANPTSAAVDDAVNQLLKLFGILSVKGADVANLDENATLEYALNSYKSPVDAAVDALITTFRNKGADRAIDLLLEGDFSTFFGLDLNTVSYSGALTQAARDVAMNDLAVRKTNRSNALSQRLIGTIPDQPNHEHEFSDADSAIPDIPGNPDVSGPGDAY
jgi:hypothetical protein